MLGAAYGQAVQAEVADHLGDGVEGAAELAQDVLARLLGLLDPHVHEAAGGSVNYNRLLKEVL